MKRLTLSTLAALAGASLLLASPAEAKRTPVRSNAVWSHILNLEADVNRADNRDTISEREAAGMRVQIAELKADYNRLNRNGLTPAQASTLENRIATLRGRLKNERRDADKHRH